MTANSFEEKQTFQLEIQACLLHHLPRDISLRLSSTRVYGNGMRNVCGRTFLLGNILVKQFAVYIVIIQEWKVVCLSVFGQERKKQANDKTFLYQKHGRRDNNKIDRKIVYMAFVLTFDLLQFSYFIRIDHKYLFKNIYAYWVYKIIEQIDIQSYLILCSSLLINK